MSKEMRGFACALLLVALAARAVYGFLGFYSIEPVRADPRGGTVIVWRADDEPFFNSADGLCLRNTGGTSLACRGAALGQAPSDRIVVRLPFQRWAYRQSTRVDVAGH